MLSQNVDRLEQDSSRYTKQKQTKPNETKQNNKSKRSSTLRKENGKHS